MENNQYKAFGRPSVTQGAQQQQQQQHLPGLFNFSNGLAASQLAQTGLTEESTALGKRPLSATDYTHEQSSKRLQAPGATTSQNPTCIHCRSSDHTWGKCKAFCLICLNRHPHRRCPKMELAAYIPGGFTIFQQLEPEERLHLTLIDFWTPKEELKNDSVVESAMNPERAAMIAVTPAPPAQVHEELGQRRTAANTIPLGKRPENRVTQPKPEPEGFEKDLAEIAAVPTTRAAASSSSAGDEGWDPEHKKVWIDIYNRVKNGIENTKAAGKPLNGLRGRTKVHERAQEALDILEPIILGKK